MAILILRFERRMGLGSFWFDEILYLMKIWCNIVVDLDTCFHQLAFHKSNKDTSLLRTVPGKPFLKLILHDFHLTCLASTASS